LEQAAVKTVAAALRDDADLSTASGAELRRVITRVHAELLHILHAGLQPEKTPEFTADVARIVADDAASFNSIQAHGVLLEGTAVEADIVKGSARKINRSRRQHVKLRDFPAIDRQFSDLTLTNIAADSGRTRIDEGQTGVADCNLGSHSRWLHCNVDRFFLTHLKRDVFVFRSSQARN